MSLKHFIGGERSTQILSKIEVLALQILYCYRLILYYKIIDTDESIAVSGARTVNFCNSVLWLQTLGSGLSRW